MSGFGRICLSLHRRSLHYLGICYQDESCYNLGFFDWKPLYFLNNLVQCGPIVTRVKPLFYYKNFRLISSQNFHAIKCDKNFCKKTVVSRWPQFSCTNSVLNSYKNLYNHKKVILIQYCMEILISVALFVTRLYFERIKNKKRL